MSAFLSEIAAAISRSSGAPFAAENAQAVHGGDISQAFKLSDDARSFFIKIQPAIHLEWFEAEAAGLTELAHANAVRVPQVVCHGMADGQAYLVLEYLSLQSHGDAAQLGRLLARQHRISATQFGGPRDNWIGATPQPNPGQASWIDFWRDQRLGFQLRLAAKHGYGGALQADGEALLTRLTLCLTDTSPPLRCCMVICGAAITAICPMDRR